MTIDKIVHLKKGFTLQNKGDNRVQFCDFTGKPIHVWNSISWERNLSILVQKLSRKSVSAPLHL
jgi:hypothetical protein